MYERLKRLYRNGEINESGLEKAVKKGWITKEQWMRLLKENNYEIKR